MHVIFYVFMALQAFLTSNPGECSLPSMVTVKDFEVLLGAADDKELLTDWYNVDNNRRPPEYVLTVSRHRASFIHNNP